jgi:hypothetical protein
VIVRSGAVPGAKRTITDDQVEQMIVIRTLEIRHAG